MGNWIFNGLGWVVAIVVALGGWIAQLLVNRSLIKEEQKEGFRYEYAKRLLDVFHELLKVANRYYRASREFLNDPDNKEKRDASCNALRDLNNFVNDNGDLLPKDFFEKWYGPDKSTVSEPEDDEDAEHSNKEKKEEWDYEKHGIRENLKKGPIGAKEKALGELKEFVKKHLKKYGVE